MKIITLSPCALSIFSACSICLSSTSASASVSATARKRPQAAAAVKTLKQPLKAVVKPATATTAAVATAVDDLVARALKDELKRSISRLRLDQYPGPYYGSYTIEQNDSCHRCQ